MIIIYNNNQICIVPYDCSLDAGSRSDQCSVNVQVNSKVLSLDLKTDKELLT